MVGESGENCWARRKCKGRSRKPLAEVILQNAPLRATSSGVPLCIRFANRKSMKTLVQQGISTW